MKLIGYDVINAGELITRDYDKDFSSIPFSSASFTSLEVSQDLEKLFKTYAGFSPEVAPVVIQSRSKVLQKIIPLRGYRTSGILVVMWGGYSHKDHWFEIPKGDYEVDVLDGKSVASVTGELAIELVEEPSNQSTGMKKAAKLSTLPIGDHHIANTKVLQTQYGLGVLIEIDDQEYWANKQLEELFRMLGGSNGVHGGAGLAIGLTLKVLEKGQTNQGHNTVKVGLSK